MRDGTLRLREAVARQEGSSVWTTSRSELKVTNAVSIRLSKRPQCSNIGKGMQEPGRKSKSWALRRLSQSITTPVEGVVKYDFDVSPAKVALLQLAHNSCSICYPPRCSGQWQNLTGLKIQQPSLEILTTMKRITGDMERGIQPLSYPKGGADR